MYVVSKALTERKTHPMSEPSFGGTENLWLVKTDPVTMRVNTLPSWCAEPK